MYVECMLNLRETHLFIRVSVENDVCLRSYEQKNFYYPNKMKQDMKATRHGTGSCGLPQVPVPFYAESCLNIWKSQIMFLPLR